MTSRSILKCLPFIAGLASAVALTLAGGPVQAEQRCIEVCVYEVAGRCYNWKKQCTGSNSFSDAVVRGVNKGLGIERVVPPRHQGNTGPTTNGGGKRAK